MLFYQTIEGKIIDLDNFTQCEKDLLKIIEQKYIANMDWTRFSCWINRQWNLNVINTDNISKLSFVWEIAQDYESKLGIKQGKVAKPKNYFEKEVVNAT